MILAGLTSVTFRDRTPQQIVQLAVEAGLKGIEWGADIHVPVGQLEHAKMVSRLTHEAGLEVSAYGSYYKVGKGDKKASDFHEILATAKSLGAPIVRIWAGEVSSKDATIEDWENIIKETRVLAYMAGQEDICLAFEFHEHTLNDTYEASYKLLQEIDHPCVNTFWQPIHGAGPDFNGAGIDMILPWIVGVHIFHWWPKVEMRLPLKEGADHWHEYMTRLSGISGSIFGNIEFVKDDSAEQFFMDAKTLLELTDYQKNHYSQEISTIT